MKINRMIEMVMVNCGDATLIHNPIGNMVKITEINYTILTNPIYLEVDPTNHNIKLPTNLIKHGDRLSTRYFYLQPEIEQTIGFSDLISL